MPEEGAIRAPESGKLPYTAPGQEGKSEAWLQ